MLHGRKEMGGGSQRSGSSPVGGVVAKREYRTRVGDPGAESIGQREGEVSGRWRNGSRLPSELCVCGGDGTQVVVWTVCATGRELGVHGGSPRARNRQW
jgi:hypothetical protein